MAEEPANGAVLKLEIGYLRTEISGLGSHLEKRLDDLGGRLLKVSEAVTQVLERLGRHDERISSLESRRRGECPTQKEMDRQQTDLLKLTDRLEAMRDETRTRSEVFSQWMWKMRGVWIAVGSAGTLAGILKLVGVF